MANNNNESNKTQRTSRKDVLLARKEQRQRQQIMRAVLAVLVAIVAVVIVFGILELVTRSRPVAEVNGEEIGLSEWQEQVRYQRAELIGSVESLNDLLGGNIPQLQQFAGQQISLLSPVREAQEAVGNLALQQMIDDILIRQEATKRGITVADVEVQDTIDEQFGYYDGELIPTATSSGPEPTPTITPIPAEDAEATEPLPTTEPAPTATPVSEEAFLELFATEISRLQDVDVSEDVYRAAVAASLYRERLQENIADEAGVETESDQVSLLLLSYATEEEAQVAADSASTSAFVELWNTIRSTTPLTSTDPIAQDVLWTDFDTLIQQTDQTVADSAFALSADDVSDVIVVSDESGENTRYVVILVQGREVRPDCCF